MLNISTHAAFLENKDELTEALEKVLYAILSKMSLEELKQIDWFTMESYKYVGQNPED